MRRIRGLLIFVTVVLLFELPSHRIAHAAAGPSRTGNDPHPSLAIIVNRSNPVENLSFVELRKIFLGERSRWPNGHRVIVATMEPGYSERETILRHLYHMTESAYRDHFLQGTYTGDIPFPPKTFSSPATLRRFVFNAPGAIGYLRASDVDGSVKVVHIDGRLPDDLEYKLQIDEGSTK
jgi:ABC-type phosphate transport system substrate-binding protein